MVRALRRLWAARRDDAGMTTAEYAVGTIAACAFGGLLIKLLSSDSTMKMLTDVVKRAFAPFLG